MLIRAQVRISVKQMAGLSFRRAGTWRFTNTKGYLGRTVNVNMKVSEQCKIVASHGN